MGPLVSSWCLRGCVLQNAPNLVAIDACLAGLCSRKSKQFLFFPCPIVQHYAPGPLALTSPLCSPATPGSGLQNAPNLGAMDITRRLLTWPLYAKFMKNSIFPLSHRPTSFDGSTDFIMVFAWFRATKCTLSGGNGYISSLAYMGYTRAPPAPPPKDYYPGRDVASFKL